MTAESSYQLLGILPDASIDEIKKAYRAKAFLVHPDKNKHPKAAAQFIELTEAYEAIIARKKATIFDYTSLFESAISKQEKERDLAKNRARAYAKMRYDEFEKTETAQTLNAVNVILNHVIFVFVCSLLLGIPLLLGYLYNYSGIIIGLLFLLAIGRPIFGFMKPYFQLKQLWLALMSLVETFFFRFIIISIANIYLLLKIGLQTLIPLYGILLLLLIPSILSCYWFFKKKESIHKLFLSFCIIPLCMQGLLLINFLGSHNPIIEDYEIWNETTLEKTSNHPSTFIQLENGAYSNFVGIRIFSDIRQLQNNEHIIYQFEDGLFGIRVMKEYRFVP